MTVHKALLIAAFGASLGACMNRQSRIETVSSRHTGHQTGPRMSTIPVVSAAVATKNGNLVVRIQASDLCSAEDTWIVERERVTDVSASGTRWVGAAVLAAAGGISLVSALQDREDRTKLILWSAAFFTGGVAAAAGPMLAERVEREDVEPWTARVPVNPESCNPRALAGVPVRVVVGGHSAKSTTDARGQAAFPGLGTEPVSMVYVRNVTVGQVTQCALQARESRPDCSWVGE